MRLLLRCTYLCHGVVGIEIVCGHSVGLAPLAEVCVTPVSVALVPLSHDGVHPAALALDALVHLLLLGRGACCLWTLSCGSHRTRPEIINSVCNYITGWATNKLFFVASTVLCCLYLPKSAWVGAGRHVAKLIELFSR